MASLGMLGFISGASKQGIAQLDRREEADRDMKKTVFAEQLRRDTAKYMMDLENIQKAGQSDKDNTQIDYERGVKILKNNKGETIREVPLTAAEKEDRTMAKRALDADTSVKEQTAKYKGLESMANIEQSRASAAASYASAENSRASASATRSLDGAGKDSITTAADVGKEMRYRYKSTADDLLKQGVPSVAIDAAGIRAAEIAKERKLSKTQTEAVYLQALESLRRGTPDSVEALKQRALDQRGE